MGFFVLGVRGEHYDIGRITYNPTKNAYDNLITFRKCKFFPNASVQYNINRMMNVALRYNKKITLPRINELNPNTNYNNGGFISMGNVNLQPTIFDSFELQVSAFHYFFFNYNHQ